MRITEFKSWEFRSAFSAPYHRQSWPPNPWRPAQAPGSVHLDLLRNGIIPDPFARQHEAAVQWVDETDWEYRATFEWEPDADLPQRVLRFEGLDTIVEIHLNGEAIGQHDNMHLAFEIDVTSRLQSGHNELKVVFRSAVRVGHERRQAYFAKEGLPEDTVWFDERAFVRKAGYMSGWDWGPRLVSAGIWKPVYLLEFASRIVDFQVFTQKLDDGRYRVWTETEVQGDEQLYVTFGDQGGAGDLDLIVDEPRLWWPNGEGDPHLYPVVAELAGGHVEMKWVGLREIKLIREPDAHGESFAFEVNGRPVFARGANWIPNDSFPGRVLDQDYEESMETAVQLGFNMLRVWGGGVYGDRDFYDACDRHGILVWQDFLYGCSHYPDDEAYQAVSRAEAEAQVKLLRHHASLALWCGNNENHVLFEGKWGGPGPNAPRYYGEVLYEKIFPEVVNQLDPQRPYIASSPIGVSPDGKSGDAQGGNNMGGYGDQHYWDVWHGRGDWIHYQDSKARMSSEFGFASACNLATWHGVVERLDISPRDPDVVWHDKTNKGYDTFLGLVGIHYPNSNTLEDWVYYSQLNQRDALRFGIEHYRTSDFCRGTLIWQYNDCWPVMSWAVQDYERLLKPAGFELGRLYAPKLVSVVVGSGELTVKLSNESPDTVEMPIEVTFYNVEGHQVGSVSASAQVAAHGNALLPSISTASYPADQTVVRVRITDEPLSETWRTLAEPKAMRWQPPKFTRTAVGMKIEGLAYDLVVRDQEDDLPLALNMWSLRGQEAICVANQEVELPPDAPARLRWRCLGGQGTV